ncbi:MAG: hypothetical protein WCB31_05720 [Nitrososphaeraceae archaeon]
MKKTFATNRVHALSTISKVKDIPCLPNSTSFYAINLGSFTKPKYSNKLITIRR